MAAAWRDPRPRRKIRSHRSAEGTFGITSPGLSERISTSAPSLGAALCAAQTIAVRIQRELRASDDEDVTISIRPLGGETAAEVVVRRDVIETFASVVRR